ncbi:murein biosynthesis integral membrane protein MurJ [Serinibacter arcticus]|uniref:Putative peptidoglycan lipid II flippase MurJ n=1 Tax=Serinibacter arcticus TaxID=1655435 RepID=A0A4Z1E1D9_9MICO|nr:murein biosynthesis integral membrane protein MurJ [Serinibacter arcticus]TGO05029.1 putative peptidoglycan lipid II flippase MurJ [Serinibacter arcticus]
MTAGKQRGLAGAAAVMFSGTFVSRGLGFVRNAILVVALASVGGASTAFTVANSLPNAIYMLLAGGVINAILVPQLVRAARDADGGRDYTNRLLTVAGAGLIVVTLILTLGATVLVTVYGAQMAPEWRPIAYAFAYWCVPQVFFYGLYTLLGQVLNARNVFGPYMWAPAANNVVAIAGLGVYLAIFGAMPREQLAAAEFGTDRIMLLAGTATLGVAVQAFVLIVPLWRAGFRYRPAWGLKGLGGASRMATWTFAALAVGQLGLVAVSQVAAAAQHAADQRGGVEGAVAGNLIYATAFMIFMLPQSLVVVSLLTAVFTRLSTKAAAKDGAGVRDDLSLAIRTVGVFTVPATVLLMVLSVPLARVITLGGQGAAADEALGRVVWTLALGIPALAMWSAVQRAYYAYEDTRSLFWIQVPMAGIVAAGTLSSVLWLGPELWVAAAGAWISISYAVGALVGYLGLRRRLPSLDGSRVLLTHLRLVMAAVPMGAVGIGAMLLWGADRGLLVSVLQVVGVGGVMGALYLWLAQRLRVTEIAFVTSRVASLARPLTARLRTMTGARGEAPSETTATGETRVVSTDSVTSGMLLADRFLVGEQIPAAAAGVRRWLGHDSILERDVEVQSVSGDHADEMLDAARRAALVTDPRLPKVLRVGEFEGTGYVVLEPLGGTPLTDVLARGPLAPDVARSITGEVAGALEAARRRGVHHTALTAASVTLTGAGAVRVAGLGVDGAAAGVTRSAGDAARVDAEGLVALLRGMVGADDLPEPGDGGDAARTELLEAIPETVRTPSNLVVALAPWRPVPAVAALLAGPDATGAEDLDPEHTNVALSVAAIAAQVRQHQRDQEAAADASAADVPDEEIVRALEDGLIAEATATGSPGIPTWTPTGAVTGTSELPRVVVEPEIAAEAEADATRTQASEQSAEAVAASAAGGAALAGAAGSAVGAGAVAAAGAAAASEAASDSGAPTGVGLGEKVRGWLRRLDAVVPAERRDDTSGSATADDAIAPEPADEAAPGSSSAEDAALAAPPFVAPDTSTWTVHPPASLEAAPASFDDALGDREHLAGLTEAGPSTRHSSGAGEGAFAAFAGGLLQRVGAGSSDRPTPETADTSSAAVEAEHLDADHLDTGRADAGTHVLPAATSTLRVTERVEPDEVAADEAPATAQPVPAQPAVERPPVVRQPKPERAPKPPKQPKPARPVREERAPSTAAQDADRYEVPDRRPPGRINATPFVLIIVLAGVAWVLYLALGSLLDAASGFGSSDPGTPAPSTSEAARTEAGDADVVPSDDLAEAATSDARAVHPADLPSGTTTAPQQF